jgi:hypothetical protein
MTVKKIICTVKIIKENIASGATDKLETPSNIDSLDIENKIRRANPTRCSK